jgi:hypothetical protein
MVADRGTAEKLERERESGRHRLNAKSTRDYTMYAKIEFKSADRFPSVRMSPYPVNSGHWERTRSLSEKLL